MAILYHVPVGTIVLCNYARGGFVPPEMVKRRPAIVVTPKLAQRDDLCGVLPLSGTIPEHPVSYVVRLELPEPLPEPFDETVWWAKCDVINTVALTRLDLFRVGRDGGKREYLRPRLTPEQIREVRTGMLNGFGLGELAQHL